MANTSRKKEWEHFGEELKLRRERAGLTQDALGLMVFVSGGYIGQFEQAVRKPQLDVAQRIDQALQTDGFFERTWRKLITDSRYVHYFSVVVDLEPLATSIYEFEGGVVPGLLQIPAYARALTVNARPELSDTEILQAVEGRMERQHILDDPTGPLYWAVLHETALRTPVGGPAVMIEQLEKITASIFSRRIMVQVIPFSEGAYPSMGKPLRLMEFSDAPPLAYTEGLFVGELLDDPAVVKKAQRTYDLLRAAALSPEVSLQLIESAAEDYRRCISST
ncbi:helix-turn-helix transcriptional regulator [Streptomyces sp. NPDC048442]|uniref:helix-turn-helix domain-containing protein n=1 Tax=Streptomyces sp. NPDC048442 TaxID=3154823 RepID=UPI0034340D87